LSQYQHVAAKNCVNNALGKEGRKKQISICASDFMHKKIVAFKRSFLNTPAEASGSPEELRRVVAILEQELGRKAERQLLPMQPGDDVPATYADIDDLARDVDFRPATAIEDGIRQFAAWYRSYHKL
jgi:nucleoside-diphosphate-sugar epimerase